MITTSKLPSKLAANAKKAASTALARKRDRATALLISIRDRKRTLAGAYWDLGRDLSELRAMKAEAALGYTSFAALCTKECGLSEAFVMGAIRVATELSREAALELGSQRRAIAFLDLAKATPEDDTPTELLRKGLTKGAVKLGKGASARKVEEAAKAIRAKAQPKAQTKRPMGKTTTPEERATAEKLEKGMAAAGFDVEVRAVATKPGQPCGFALRFLPRAGFRALAKLLREV
ncbi:MAG: hypothetical protein IPK71_03990 [Myxococcales bacterium]|nr:hypothetical protein [Myxococcales bacterium]